MQITIDGQEVTTLDTTGRTVGELLAELRASLAGTGRMIVGIVCDSEPVEPEQVKALLDEPIDKYAQIDFQTAQPAELARSSLEACRQFLVEIEQTAREVIDSLRQAQVQEAMGQMSPLFTRLNDAYRGLQGTFELFKIDPESIELSSGDAARFMSSLRDKLAQIRDTLENHDYVELADLFEYELTPAIKQWQELNEHLLETISSM